MEGKPMSTRGRLYVAAEVVVTACVVSTALLWLVKVGPNPVQGATASKLTLPTAPVPIAHSPVDGSASAAVAMIVFSEFECPFCGRFSRDTLPEIRKTYVETGRLAVVFKHLPLPIHARARPAAV